jgi:hypothetical protein
MKKELQIWAFLLLIFMFTASITKPSDTECIRQIAREQAGQVGTIANMLDISQHLISVQDRVLWKDVYSTVTGNKIGYAAFGQVIAMQ